jgi:DNA-binding beta-propeller fold protein YncE
MQFSVRSLLLTVLAGAIVGPAVAQQSPAPMGVPTTTAGTPKFQPEPFWPKPLPGNWILGQVAGLAVSPDNRIWIVHRPATLVDDEKGATKNPPETKCCTAAPPVLEFDTDGNLLRHWGGKGEGFEWPKNEHGLHVDKQGNVWVGGNDEIDHHILKFSADGKFLQQYGKQGSTGGSNSQTQLGRPAHLQVDAAANELYVADGYKNRRIVVFDINIGAYKRHWGAYGKKPSDDKLPPYDPSAPLSEQFSNPVHCVRLSNDGHVYVCDRANDRIQVFRKDGTFVKEFRVEPQTRQNGSVWDLVLSEDAAQKYIFVADGANGQIHALDRQDGKMLTQWGRHGRQPGQFKSVHNMGIDSQGNLYTAEVGFGRRVQKFRRTE